MPRPFFKTILPFAAIGLAAALSGCSWTERMGSFDGVPLAELDMTGEAPTGVALAGPDRLIVTEGAALDIDVEADPEIADLLRFKIEDGVLGVGRENSDWKDRMSSSGKAIIRVTMPSLNSVEVAGSGTVEAARVQGDVAIDIAGSGKVEIAAIEAGSLNVEIAGSGTVTGAGTANSLSLEIAGSGDVDLEKLQAGSATIDIAGSGDAIFASDGEVKASIAGSGDVVVIGRARCSVKTAGSGSLTCRPADSEADTDASETADS